MNRIVAIVITLISISCSNKDDVDKLNFLTRGNDAFLEGNNDKAIGMYNEALAIDSSFVDAWNNRGLVQMTLNQYDEAIFSFNTAIQIKPDYADAQLNYIKANLEVGQYYASLDGLEALEKAWQDTSIIYFTRGLVYHEMDENELALRSFKKALLLDSENLETQINIANIYYHESQYDSAISLLKTVISQEADNPYAYNILAMCYSNLGELQKAENIIETAFSLDGQDAYILNNKGYIAMQNKKFNDAEKLYIQSMKRDPFNAWVYRNLGLLRIEQNKLDEAERMLSKAYGIDPKIDNITSDYINVLVKNKNYQRACSILESDSSLHMEYQAVLSYCKK